MIFQSSTGEEIDWAALSYISTDEFPNAEDLFEHLGFMGIKLKERQGINSIYVFDQTNLTFGGTIDLTDSDIQQQIVKFYRDFKKDKNFLEENQSSLTVDNIANNLIKEPRSTNDILANVSVELVDEAWQRDRNYYIGSNERGLDMRRRGVRELINLGDLKYAPIVNIIMRDGLPVLSFIDGRHRFAELRDMGAKTINLAFRPES